MFRPPRTRDNEASGFGRTGEADARYSRRNFKAEQQGFCRWSLTVRGTIRKGYGKPPCGNIPKRLSFPVSIPGFRWKTYSIAVSEAVRGADCRQLCQCGCVGLPRIRLQGIGREMIVVLGHEHCGAIKSVIDHVQLGHVTAMLSNLQPAVARANETFRGEKNASNPEYVKRSVYSQYTTCGSRNPLGKRYSEKNGRQRRNRNRRRHLPHENRSRYFL